jgi:hypothetical protein
MYMSTWFADKKNVVLALMGIAVLSLLLMVFSPFVVLGVALAIAVVGLVFVRPESGVVMLMAYTPFEPFLLKFVPDDVYVYTRYASEMVIYVLIASLAWRYLARRMKVPLTPIDLPFVMLLLVAVTSIVINAVPALSAVLGVRQIIRFILLFFAVVYLMPKEKFIKSMTVMMGVIVVLQAGLGLVQAASGGAIDDFLLPSEGKFLEGIQLTAGTQQFWSQGTRIFATMGRYDQLGQFLCLFLLLGAGLLYFAGRQRDVRTLWIVMVMGLPALLLTLSRASWFGFVLGLLIIAAYFMRDRRFRVGAVVAIVLAAGYVAYSGLVVRYLIESPEQTIVERFFESFSLARFQGEYYGLGRVYWMVQTPFVVATSPFFGVGPSMYGGGAAAALHNTKVYDALGLPFGVYGTDGYIDNNWFSLWGELGTIGVLVYLWMFVVLLLMSVRVFRKAHEPYVKGLALGFVGVIFAVSFQAFLATAFEIRTLAVYFWIYAAFVYVLGVRQGVFGERVTSN